MSALPPTVAPEVPIWDLGVRLFHWSMVTAVATSFLAEEGESLHEWAGYAVAVLLGFRIIWGLIGSQHARFSDFITGPREVLRYLTSRASTHPRRYLGHNPAGAAMILTLMLLLATVSGTGVAMTFDSLWGNATVETIHRVSAWVLLGFVAVHVSAVLLMSFLDKENLIRAMITGKKRL
jgi:cytochrome b